ncbi:MAG: GGDEF domain-containing protein [Campylobacteraceae bacterium]|nr:GGDEF domain-containing protein [Campylobacteraceae bacterium]
MLHISINKTLFEDILSNTQKQLIKEASRHWKKVLLDPKIIDDKLYYEINKINKLYLSNGLGQEKPAIVIECKNILQDKEQNQFIFELGAILEHKNIDINKKKDELIEQLLREKQLLEESIAKDHLTQTFNRRKMDMDLEMFIKQANAKSLSAVFIDADRFKGINDNFGHNTGDRALQYLAKKLQKHAHVLEGEVYRYGGEEFVILCFCPQEQIFDKLDALRVDIKSEKILHPFKEISISVSMGVSFWKDAHSIENFIKKADEAVYLAKSNGRDRIEIITTK